MVAIVVEFTVSKPVDVKRATMIMSEYTITLEEDMAKEFRGIIGLRARSSLNPLPVGTPLSLAAILVAKCAEILGYRPSSGLR